MLPTRLAAETALEEARAANPGPWADHARRGGKQLSLTGKPADIVKNM